MTPSLFKYVKYISPLIPIKYYLHVTGQSLICPFYHIVTDDEVPHIQHVISPRTIQHFRADLDYFLSEYEPIDYVQVLDWVSLGKQLPPKAFLLTFDDGLSEFHDIVAPILNEKGIPAICFLNSAFVDNKDLFFRFKASLLIDKIQTLSSKSKVYKELTAFLTARGFEHKKLESSILSIDYQHKQILSELAELVDLNFDDFLAQKQPYLTSEQIEKLIGQGFHFGAHSVDHPQYRYLSLEDQVRQTEESINWVYNRFSLEHKLFAFPFTDFGIKMNYFDHIYFSSDPIADLSFGTAGLKKDIVSRNIQRIPMERGNCSARKIISSEYFYWVIKSFFYKNLLRR